MSSAQSADVMTRYKVHGTIGDGAFGAVFKAESTVTGEMVAIKRMKRKFTSWQECIELREVKSLRKMVHPNIIRMREVIREKEELFLVFEYCETSLYDRMETTWKEGRQFDESQIQRITYQLLSAMAHMHKHGFFHRDIKPENMLMQGEDLKCADFGLAREVRSRPPYTEYVSTRWYRAPEILLHSTTYNSPIDLWATGALMAELYLGRPLFPGTSETDQIYKTCSLLGTPTPETWRDSAKLAANMNVKFPQFAPTPLATLIPNASPEAIALLNDLLKWEPSKRPRADEALQHPYFASISCVPSTPLNPELSFPTLKQDGQEVTEQPKEEGEKADPDLTDAALQAMLDAGNASCGDLGDGVDSILNELGH